MNRINERLFKSYMLQDRASDSLLELIQAKVTHILRYRYRLTTDECSLALEKSHQKLSERLELNATICDHQR